MRATSILHAVVIILLILVAPASVLGASAKDVFSKVASSIVVVLALDNRGDTIAQGSGVVVGKYEVVTNCHVLEKAKDLMVRQAADWSRDKAYEMPAFLLARNDERDLCLLFVDDLPIPPVARPARLSAAKKLSVGEEVYAIGAPAGLELSLSRGIVSQLRSASGKQSAPLIQTDAAISSGSSGGGLFNQAGELVGITTFKWRGESLNFAIPSEWIKELLTQRQTELIKANRRMTCMTNPKYSCVMELALHAANSEEFPLKRAELLYEVAAAQKKIGDIRGAKHTLIATAHAASRAADTFALLSIKNLADVFVAQTRIRDEQAAKQTLTVLAKGVNEIITDPSHPSRDQALAYLASALAKTGDIVSSLDVSSRIADGKNHRSRALADIAQAHAEAGDIANAMKTAIGIHNNFQRNQALLMVSDIQAKAGDFERARKTVREIDELAARKAGFLRVAGWQLISGNTEAAERTMVLVSASEPFGDWFRMLSSIILARKGNFAAAITIVDSLPRNQNGRSIRVALLNEIAIMQYRAGKPLEAKQTLANALRVAQSRSDARGRAVLVSTVAAAQAKAGDPESARQTFWQAAAAFEGARKKDAPDWVLRSDPHSLPSYIRDALTISGGWLLRADLKLMAQAQAKAGFYDKALKTALSIDVIKYRVEALIDIARNLVGIPMPPAWDPRRPDF